MEDLAVYGYVTPMKLKIVIAIALADTVVRDTDVVLVSPAVFTRTILLFTSIYVSANRFLRPCIRHIVARLPIPS